MTSTTKAIRIFIGFDFIFITALNYLYIFDAFLLVHK